MALRPYYSELLDDLETNDLASPPAAKLVYGGSWSHKNGQGMYNYQRSLSTGGSRRHAEVHLHRDRARHPRSQRRLREAGGHGGRTGRHGFGQHDGLEASSTRPSRYAGLPMARTPCSSKC